MDHSAVACAFNPSTLRVQGQSDSQSSWMPGLHRQTLPQKKKNSECELWSSSPVSVSCGPLQWVWAVVLLWRLCLGLLPEVYFSPRPFFGASLQNYFWEILTSWMAPWSRIVGWTTITNRYFCLRDNLCEVWETCASAKDNSFSLCFRKFLNEVWVEGWEQANCCLRHGESTMVIYL